jgi:hypothetical protein
MGSYALSNSSLLNSLVKATLGALKLAVWGAEQATKNKPKKKIKTFVIEYFYKNMHNYSAQLANFAV